MTVGIVMEMSYATGLHTEIRYSARSCTIRLYYDCGISCSHMDFKKGVQLDGKN